MTTISNADSAVVKLTSELIKLDTSNPPGNEEIAVQFLEGALKQAGIKSDIYMAEPTRANILARIKGKKSGEPIVLLGHLDVVPAHDEGWIEPPFSGAVRDGYLYGRGAIDMKAQVICQLLSFIELAHSGVTPERDIIFLGTADEETGGKLGIEYILTQVDELSDASFVLSEGGHIVDEGERTHARISVGEKKLSQFRISAKGTGGHGSMPHKNNANEKIMRATNRIMSTPMPFKPTRIVSAYLNGLLKGKKIAGKRFSTLTEALRDKSFCTYVENDPVYNALLKNTITLTMLKSGKKINVIPTEAAAYFDSRILPETDHGRFMDRISRIAGPEVEVQLLSRSDSIPSPFNTPYFKQIGQSVRGVRGNIPVLPFLTTGATDLRYFRALGIPAYGFFPVTMTAEEDRRMHSQNERISLKNLEEGLTMTEEIVRFLASYTPPEIV